MTAEELKAIRERAAAVGSERWGMTEDRSVDGGVPLCERRIGTRFVHVRNDGDGPRVAQIEAECEFVRNAPADVSALLAEVERAREAAWRTLGPRDEPT
jgi:hypothetical protein